MKLKLRRLLCKLGFHGPFTYYGVPDNLTFLGENMKRVRKQYRRCNTCGKWQDRGGLTQWSDLPKWPADVLDKKVESGFLQLSDPEELF